MATADYRAVYTTLRRGLTVVVLGSCRSPLSIAKHKGQSGAEVLLRSPLGEAAWSPSGSKDDNKKTVNSRKSAGGPMSGGACGQGKVCSWLTVGVTGQAH